MGMGTITALSTGVAGQLLIPHIVIALDWVLGLNGQIDKRDELWLTSNDYE